MSDRDSVDRAVAVWLMLQLDVAVEITVTVPWAQLWLSGLMAWWLSRRR